MNLKICPFCSGLTLYYTVDQGTKWGRVECVCGARGPEVRTQYNIADNAPWHENADVEWNRRSYNE